MPEPQASVIEPVVAEDIQQVLRTSVLSKDAAVVFDLLEEGYVRTYYKPGCRDGIAAGMGCRDGAFLTDSGTRPGYEPDEAEHCRKGHYSRLRRPDNKPAPVCGTPIGNRS